MKEELIHGHTVTAEKEVNIASHNEAPKNIGELQMSLMEELYSLTHPSEKLNIKDRDDRNKMGDYWVDSGCSARFRKLIDYKEQKGEDPMEINLSELTGFAS